MKRTDAAHHVGNLFQSGNPLTGQRGTRVDHTFLNSVQEELANTIEAAGIALDESDTGQLLKAIRKLGIPGFPDIASAISVNGAALIPADVQAIHIAGYTRGGEGGARYMRADAEPIHPGKFRDAVGQWWELAEFRVTPMMFGASPDFDDNGSYINSALMYGREVFVPDGIALRVDTPVVLNREGMHLHIGARARLYAGPNLVGPVVRCTTNRFRLTGNGGVIEKAYPTGGLSSPTLEGVVNIGPENETVYRNINFFDVEGLTIRGDLAKWGEYHAGINNDIDANIGLKMVNGNMFGQSGSCFNGRIRELDIEAFGIGIDCERVVQGNNFHLINFHKITNAGIQMEGCHENSVNQTFFHGSHGVTMVRLRTTADDGRPYASRGCLGNSFTSLMGEPGPNGPFDNRHARMIDFGAGCNENYVQGYGNTGHVWIDNGLRNTLINRTSVTTDGEHTFRSRPVLLEGVDFRHDNIGHFEQRGGRQVIRDWSNFFTPTNPAVPRAMFTLTSGAVGNVGLVKFDLMTGSGATSNIGSAAFHLRFRTTGANEMSAEIEQVGGTTAYNPTVAVNGATATVSITPSHPVHSRFAVMLHATAFNPITIAEL